MRSRLRSLAAFLADNREEIGVLLGALALCGGLSLVSLALALIAVGLVLLWLHLPPRMPFVHKPGPPARRKS